MRAIGLPVMLGIIGLLAAALACDGDSSPSVSETASPEGVTWVLRTLDGEPVVDGTFVWMRLDGNEFGGLDGCNTFGGRHEDGKPVASADGGFDAPPMAGTLIGCEIPVGILEQSDRYIELLRQGRTFRVEGDRLTILGGQGEERLGFVRQAPLAGQPVELADTAWRLMAEDSTDTGVRAATLVFLDERHAVGITACRGYVAAYEVSRERLNFYASGMTESGISSACSEEARRREGQFTNYLSRGIEYSVSEEDGTRRLRIRTSRGRTATFEPLEAGTAGMFGTEWHFKALLDVSRTDPDRSLAQRTDRLIPGTKVTARFIVGRGVSGFGGCNPYSARLEPEESFAKRDGTFTNGAMVIEATVKGCPDPPGVMEQDRRFTGLIAKFERYRIYGELLVVHTSEDVVLLFQKWWS